MEQVISGFFGSVGFALLFHLKGKQVLFTALGGGIAWFVYLATETAIASSGMRFLIAGAVLGFYMEWMAIYTKMPRTAYIAVGIIPLIPGAALYHTMYYFFEGKKELGIEYAMEAVVTSVAIAAGLILAMNVWKTVRNGLKK